MKKESLDLDRLFSFSFYGLTINGPMLHCAYHHIIPWLAPGKNGPSAIAKKMLFSQTIFTFVSIGTFYATLPLFQGQSIQESYNELYSKMVPTLKTNYKIWPIL